MNEIVLGEDLVPTGVSPGPWMKSQNLADCEVVGDTVWVRRNRKHWVGRLLLPDEQVALVAKPDFPDRLFADFFGYAKLGRISTSPAMPAAESGGTLFQTLVARLFVEVVEEDLVNRLSRRYRERVERSQVLRGRPLWSFGRPVLAGVDCRVHWLNVDNLLNRLILAGLRVAHRLLRSSKTSTLLYQFRSQVRDVHPRASDFNLARSKLNALTRHYGPALELARSLVLKLDPDLFQAGSGRMVGFEIDVPQLFESFVHNLVAEALPRLRVVSQTVDGQAFLDDWGATYRSIRPDTVVFDGDIPLVVLDAKYKPRYLRDGKKASTADLYQLFFYQNRLRERAALACPPTAALVAPSFGSTPPLRKRIVHRAADDNASSAFIVSLPIEQVLEKLSYGPEEALSAAPELYALLAFSCGERGFNSATNRNSFTRRAV